MTISSTSDTSELIGNGVATVLDLTFRFFSDADVKVYLVDITTGNETLLTQGVHYTITGAGDPEVDGMATGKVTAITPPATGTKLVAKREMEITQPTDVVNQGRFFANIHENVFDRLTMLIQQIGSNSNAGMRKNLLGTKWNALGLAIGNVGAPTEADDAATLAYVQSYVAAILETGQGPVNNAANVLYAPSIGSPTTNVASFLDRTTDGMLWFSRDLGGVPGAGDNSAAFAAAIALGKPIYFEPGSYLLQTFEQVPAAGCRLVGAGMAHTELLFSTAVTTAINAFVLSNANVTFENIKVRVTGPVGATVQTFALRANNLTFDSVEVDGENTALNANVINAFNFADTNVDNLRVMNCDIHNVQRVNLRTNTNTGVATNLLYQNNRFRNMGQGGLQFNFPLGSISGVRVLGNVFRDFHAGTERIYTGGASLTNATFAGNVFLGAANECIHLEEGGDNITITGNVMAANAHGVILGDNNVGGSFKAPSRVTITGNSFLDGSLTRANEAVRAPNNGVGIDSYSGLLIADNVIRGYDRGLNLAAGAQAVRGNYIVNCNIGARSEKLGPWLAGNTFQNCSTAISGINGAGLVGKNSFVEPIIYAASEDGSRVSMAGFTLDITSDVSLPAGAATLVATGLPLAAGNRMWGSIRGVMGSSSTRFRHRASEITFDGTTLTDTQKVEVGSGDIAFTGFVLDASQLKARLNNTGALQTMRHLAIEFDGIWTSAA